ncbi:patatin-like phospholipase family protein [Candidatus Bodocaedibacter vickermanii]|uniref:Alpha/beta hydrolase n=1 Tax=Candidatus Bodocaedibacter vickermanii TaxID=2741701 RepID=A0A7L9RUX8_9PROT|nr:alpha/beta hydrolase [Candidatus Paracaedibacteraceae bacterium 'Lake Konstanz']
MAKAEQSQKKKVSLALQGGGAHGAFTWGVIDRLLEENVEVDGIVGTSAGAMNAVSVLQGLIEGGNDGARKTMRKFWEGVGEKGKDGPLKPMGDDKKRGNYTMYNSFGYIMFDNMIKNMSPYQFNKDDKDPLKEVIEATFDFETLSRETKHKVFLCATHIRDGKVKIFKNEDLCPEAMLASGCLPLIHKAVAVGGEYYWDGGFTANPAIYPLIYGCEAPSIIIVQLNPTLREDVPKDVRGISDRLNEISNNVTMMRELRAINMITKWIDDGHLKPSANAKRLDVHIIQNDQVFQPLGFSSKLNSTPEFLHYLFDEGRKCADKWLYNHWDMVGVNSTADHYMDNDF